MAGTPTPVAALPVPARTRPARWSPAAVGGFVVLALVCVTAVAAPWLAPHDPMGQVLERRLLPPAWTAGGDWAFPLGADHLGRDILSRLIFGSRISLLVGVTAVAISGLLGVTLGLLAGYYGGRFDTLLMRMVDVQLAFPFILLAITVVAVLGAGLRNVIIVLGVAGWTVYARVVRGQVLSLREMEFVVAARAIGVPNHVIIPRHLLPNVMTPVVIMATFAVATNIITEASLSFLGLGVEPRIPTWGSMLSDGRAYIGRAWWLTTFPGLAILVTVLSINLLGDWLRDRLDPRLRNL
jgi:peptide/nickel transport system permease protein